MAARGRERFVYVNRWPDFQHYKQNTRPPWIKNYTRLLHDTAYLGLSEHQALLLHRLWLVYAESGRILGASPAQLGRMVGMNSVRTRDLEALKQAGFIRVVSRATLEKLYSDPALEVEVEKEKAFDFEEARPLQNGHSEKFKIPELRSVEA